MPYFLELFRLNLFSFLLWLISKVIVPVMIQPLTLTSNIFAHSYDDSFKTSPEHADIISMAKT